MLRRRTLLTLTAASWAARARAQGEKRITVAFANITEDTSVRLEGTGFTGPDVHESFYLAARLLPIDLVFYDSALDRAKALANADEAARRHVDVFVQYGWDEGVSGDIARRLAEAEIPALAIGQPMPRAPLYAADNAAAGRIAGEALVRHAGNAWPEQAAQAGIIGPGPDAAGHLEERLAGITAALKPLAGAPARLDTGGNPLRVESVLRPYLTAHAGQKIVVAALDDATGLAAKATVEGGGRNADVVIASHGCDHSVHGNASERKELDPANRGSILLGSVGFFLDRYGQDVLPLAIRLAARDPVPQATRTRHRLVTPANVFAIYPPIDMN